MLRPDWDDSNALARRAALGRSRRWVVKIGSALATNAGVGLNVSAIEEWAGQIAARIDAGCQIVLVTSGSVAEGTLRLGWSKRPDSIHRLQAAAAVGQMGLVRAWDRAFAQHGRHSAQILLTHDDLADRQRYLNARSTLWELLDLGVVPVVNENDTVATDEIRLGDNDTLAGFVSNLIDADLLVILTDQVGLMSADPRDEPTATRIAYAPFDAPELAAVAGGSGTWGRGGMRTKVRAAALAARSATATIIAPGRHPDILGELDRGADIGTLLDAPATKLAARKQWLAGTLHEKGRLVVDGGAARVLRQHGRSLLAVGVVRVDGRFRRGELVACVDDAGVEVARGLVNYDAEEIRAICGLSTAQIKERLGYLREPELIHRDNLVVV